MGELSTIKRVLFLASSREREAELLGLLDRLDEVELDDPQSDESHFRLGRVTIRLVVETDVPRGLERLHSEYFNLLLVDVGRTGSPVTGRGDSGLALVRALYSEADVEARYAFHRILAWVDGADQRSDALIAELGALGVRRFIRQFDDALAFSHRLADALLDTMFEERLRKRALCLSGGGITGIYYELGVLKCLADCLPPGAINTFDMFFGISAGAVVSGLLSTGYGVDEIMAGMAGRREGRMQPVDLSILRLRHLNLADLARRLGGAALGVSMWLARFLAGRATPSPQSVFFEYSDLIGPPFRTDGYERLLRDLLTRPGLSGNSFHRLPKPLFIGATDQDTRRHVLFGARGFDEVAISRAIQASMSLNPAFAATRLGHRYYEDGAATRTSNFSEAIRRGADLLVVVNPLVPFVSRVPGYSHARGFLYNVDQDIRSLSFSRFENARLAVLREHPEVSFYSFLPGNELRRQLSNNPLDHRHYLRIWRGAYLSTLHRVALLRHRLRGDFLRYGLTFDLARPNAVAERLRAVREPRFRDFYPEGQVVVRPPPIRAADGAVESPSSESPETVRPVRA